MQLNQTVKVRLYPSEADKQAFFVLSEQYRKACNFVSDCVFDHGFELNSNKLSRTLYQTIRSEFQLKSQLTQSVFRTVTAQYKTTKTQLRQKPYRFQDENGKYVRIYKDLEWLQKPIYFGRKQADLVRNRDYSLVENNTLLSINTLSGRGKIPFDTKGFESYLDGSWSFGTAKLVELNGNWFLHVSVSKEVPDFDKNAVEHVVGIDRGLRFLAVSHDEKGTTSFIDGKGILKKRETFNGVRQELQKKGTKSAKRRLKKISQRENRWMSDVNHQIAKTLVENYGDHSLFVLEDLTGVTFDTEQQSRKQRNQHRSWSFYQLEQYLAYKAHNKESEVVKISAAYTSQRCPKCGSVHKESRDHRLHEYHCQNCSYRSNDDRTAAMNIQLLGTRWVTGEENPRFEKITID